MVNSRDDESCPAVLLYRATCPKCRLASAVVVTLACGRIRRIPVDSPEALGLYARFGRPAGTLALLYRGDLRTGRAIPRSILLADVRAACALVAHVAHRATAMAGRGDS
jgi:hypothetical protein